MATIYIVPEWFFKLSLGLELVFSIVTLIVAIYALRVYRIFEQREVKLLSTSFFLISISYLMKAALNLFVLKEVREGVRILNYNSLNTIGILGFYSYVILFMTGLVTLTYITFKIKNWRVYSLILATNLIIIFFNNDKAFAFNLLSSILLFYVVIHYSIEYKNKKNSKTLLVLLAFIALFLSGLGFVFAENYYANYVIGHLLELASYLLMLTSLILTIRKK